MRRLKKVLEKLSTLLDHLSRDANNLGAQCGIDSRSNELIGDS